ncbi:MAG: glutathione peroxidase [Alphaproteobacteria bacterium]|nr:glutathione peroxidase [Alphaproteobacteria bacterium]
MSIRSLAAALGLLALAAPTGGSFAADGAAPSPASAHDIAFTSIDGQPLPFSGFAGKAVLVVNTASFCGFTPQYKGLQALWERYRDRGLVVLGVPANDFGGQEPGSNDEIKDFCETTFAVDFPLTEKASVVGETAHPFYVFARESFGAAAVPRWNFHKILVGTDGQVAAAFPTRTTPEDEKLIAAIEAALPKPDPGM